MYKFLLIIASLNSALATKENKCIITNLNLTMTNQEGYIDITTNIQRAIGSVTGRTITAIVPYMTSFGHNTLCSVGCHTNSFYFVYRQLASVQTREANITFSIFYED